MTWIYSPPHADTSLDQQDWVMDQTQRVVNEYFNVSNQRNVPPRCHRPTYVALAKEDPAESCVSPNRDLETVQS